MLKLSFISKNTRETDNTLEKSTKILYDAYIGSPGASLSCLRGYKSNMAPGTVKRAIPRFAPTNGLRSKRQLSNLFTVAN